MKLTQYQFNIPFKLVYTIILYVPVYESSAWKLSAIVTGTLLTFVPAISDEELYKPPGRIPPDVLNTKVAMTR